MRQLSVFTGAFRYEFFMQIRRRMLWITYIVLITLVLVIQLTGGDKTDLHQAVSDALKHFSLQTVVASWTFELNGYGPLCAGLLLADRLLRDRRRKVDELFNSLPATFKARLFGKYLGSMIASIVPMLLIYCIGIGYILSLSGNWLTIPLAIETFIVIVLPGLLFISAFSLALPLLLTLPLYLFGFIGYWLWTSLWFHREILNLARTIISPIGVYSYFGFFNGKALANDPRHPVDLTITPWQGLASVLVLTAIALLVILALDGLVKWRQTQQ